MGKAVRGEPLLGKGTIVIRELMVGVGAAAALIAGMTGCSGKKTETTATATSGSVTAAAGTGSVKVSIDGQPKDIEGQIACTTAMGNLNIGIGAGATGIAVVMSPDAAKVTSVALGNIDGVALAFHEGAGGEAKASKDGNTYKISGTATGMDMANPLQPTEKPFEIEVTCP